MSGVVVEEEEAMEEYASCEGLGKEAGYSSCHLRAAGSRSCHWSSWSARCLMVASLRAVGGCEDVSGENGGSSPDDEDGAGRIVKIPPHIFRSNALVSK